MQWWFQSRNLTRFVWEHPSSLDVGSRCASAAKYLMAAPGRAARSRSRLRRARCLNFKITHDPHTGVCKLGFLIDVKYSPDESRSSTPPGAASLHAREWSSASCRFLHASISESSSTCFLRGVVEARYLSTPIPGVDSQRGTHSWQNTSTSVSTLLTPRPVVGHTF